MGIPLPKLIFVTGKGGVGKTTVTSALATLLAEQGHKVAATELGTHAIGSYFGGFSTSYEGTRFANNLDGIHVEAKNAFREYCLLSLPHPALYRVFLDNRIVERFLQATPGLKEILCLGKLANLVRQSTYDYVLVDSPATGHVISLLDAPRIALQVFRHGPLKKQVKWILEYLQDPKTTGFLIVGTPAQWSLEEIVELQNHLLQVHRLRGVACIVNGVTQNSFNSRVPPSELNIQWEDQTSGGGQGESPLLIREILQRYKRKNAEEKLCLQKFCEEVVGPLVKISWRDEVFSLSDVREHVASELKVWIQENF